LCLAYCWEQSMAISVNSETMPYLEGETVSELLARMNYVFPMLVVVVDGTIIDETDFSTRQFKDEFKDGATIEVIHLTSGG
jgi:thiamine biosynthesis protein ThiS